MDGLWLLLWFKFYGHFLTSRYNKTFQPTLYLACPSPGSSHFSGKSWIILVGMVFRSQHLGSKCAHCYEIFIFSKPFQLMELGNRYNFKSCEFILIPPISQFIPPPRPPFPPLVSIRLFSTSVSLFLPCKSVHCTIFLDSTYMC